MAGAKINTYSSSYTSLTNYATCIDHQRLGYHSISLTNMTTTAVPAIAGGSVCEINGSLYEFSTDETISSTGVTDSTGVYWIKLCPTSSVVTAEFTTTWPTYVASKHGWFASTSDNNRYINYFVSVSSAYYIKGEFLDNHFTQYRLAYWSSSAVAHTPSTLVASFSTTIEPFNYYLPVLTHQEVTIKVSLRGWLSTAPASSGYYTISYTITNGTSTATNAGGTRPYAYNSTSIYDCTSTSLQPVSIGVDGTFVEAASFTHLQNTFVIYRNIWQVNGSSNIAGTANCDYHQVSVYVQ